MSELHHHPNLALGHEVAERDQAVLGFLEDALSGNGRQLVDSYAYVLQQATVLPPEQAHDMAHKMVASHMPIALEPEAGVRIVKKSVPTPEQRMAFICNAMVYATTTELSALDMSEQLAYSDTAINYCAVLLQHSFTMSEENAQHIALLWYQRALRSMTNHFVDQMAASTTAEELAARLTHTTSIAGLRDDLADLINEHA